MDSKDIVARTFGQKTTGTKDDGGYWHLHVITTETVTYPDGTTKEESIESECVDRDFDVAHQVALHSVFAELQMLVYDRNLNSLIEGKELQRKLEADDDSGSEADEDTPVQ